MRRFRQLCARATSQISRKEEGWRNRKSGELRLARSRPRYKPFPATIARYQSYRLRRYSFGDFVKAREAGHRSVLAASHARVKAASLYNLGRVEEASGGLAQAAKLYRDSLALRDNAVVRARLANLGEHAVSVSGNADKLVCAHATMNRKELCACIAQEYEYREGSCEISDETPGLALISAEISRDETLHLLAAKQESRYLVVAVLGHVYNPGMMGISEEWQLVDVERKQISNRTVVRFSTNHWRVDHDRGINETEERGVEEWTYCVISSGITTTCPLQIAHHMLYTRDLLFPDEPAEPEAQAMQTKGLPIHEEYALTGKLLPNGIVEIRTAKGTPDPSLLGDRRLF